MEDDLLVGKLVDLCVEINEEILEVLVVGHEEAEELIGFFESYGCYDLKVLDIGVKLFENGSFIRIKYIIPLFPTYNLTNRMRSY